MEGLDEVKSYSQDYITWLSFAGLRKVTNDMKTKYRTDRVGTVPASSSKDTHVSDRAITAVVKVGSPKFELQMDRKWVALPLIHKVIWSIPCREKLWNTTVFLYFSKCSWSSNKRAIYKCCFKMTISSIPPTYICYWSIPFLSFYMCYLSIPFLSYSI